MLRIYPKHGPSFTVEIFGVEYTDDGLVLIDANNKPSQYGFLSLTNIAAIVPDEAIDGPTQPHLEVFLQGRDPEDENHPISIAAHVFDLDDPPSVRFYRLIDADPPKPREIIPNLYVAISEVVAIVPV